jgi:excisionase family DNA binding protein
MESLLTVPQAAKTLNICPRTLWTLTREGAIACIRIGRRVFYEQVDIREFIGRCRQSGNNQQNEISLQEVIKNGQPK